MYVLVLLMVVVIVVGSLGGAGVFNPKAEKVPSNNQLSSIYNMLQQMRQPVVNNNQVSKQVSDQGFNDAFDPYPSYMASERVYNSNSDSSAGSCGSCRRGPFHSRS